MANELSGGTTQQPFFFGRPFVERALLYETLFFAIVGAWFAVALWMVFLLIILTEKPNA